MQTLPTQEAALQQLAQVPGVVGGLVFGGGGDVVAAQFPPVFDRAGLDQLARQLAGDGYFQEWLTGDEAGLDLRFGDGTVLVRAVDASWLLVLCTSQANPQLLSMSLTQVVRRLRMTPALRPAPAAAPAPAAPPAPAPSRADLLRNLIQSELGPHAPQALEIVAAAGEGQKELRRAADDVERFTKLFISTKKAGELARKMKDVLGG